MMAEPIVSLNHIVKSFGAKQVLKDLSFSITPATLSVTLVLMVPVKVPPLK